MRKIIAALVVSLDGILKRTNLRPPTMCRRPPQRRVFLQAR